MSSTWKKATKLCLENKHHVSVPIAKPVTLPHEMLYNLLTRTLLPAACGNGERLAFQCAMSSTSATDTILVDEIRNKGVLTLNRPRILNAVNIEMVKKTHEHLKKFEKSKMLVIVKGAGEKSFTVGADIGSVLGLNLLEKKDFFREVYTMNKLISNYKIPYVALIDGLTMGGGVGLSVHGRYCVATERTVLAMPETGIGLFPDVGSSYFLSRLKGKLGLYLGMTGHRLKGEDVAKAGLATHYCESSKLSKLEDVLLKCKDLDDIPDIVNSLTSKSSKEFCLSRHFETINKCFSGKTVEEIFQNLERDGSEWALDTLKTLKKMSPLSLKLTHKQLNRGAKLPLVEGLKMEFRMVSRCLENSDFQEGVRALIIDKDKKPKWNPSTLEAVTDERVDEFFAKLPDAEELTF